MSSTAPRIVLGMTLYNHARHLSEAADSLLAQTCGDFRLLMLDDGSSDATESIARDYERRDRRVRYLRHEVRQGMVSTWREVVQLAAQDCPSAVYFAWASDHDRWHPEWLARLSRELDEHPEVVLAYPLSAWIDDDGVPVEKRPRRFTTRGIADRRRRWAKYCREAVGAGDMVYGLMRLPALEAAGIFRLVLRPDRLLIAELTLQGEISQIEESLWTRRQGSLGSIARQANSLVATSPPWWFRLPPWVQHARVLIREYRAPGAVVGLSRLALWRMVLLYQVTYTWRHIRRTETAHRMGELSDGLQQARKDARRLYADSRVHARQTSRWLGGTWRRQVRRARYELPLLTRATTARMRRAVRHRVRDVLVLTRRLGLRGGSSDRP